LTFLNFVEICVPDSKTLLKLLLNANSNAARALGVSVGLHDLRQPDAARVVSALPAASSALLTRRFA